MCRGSEAAGAGGIRRVRRSARSASVSANDPTEEAPSSVLASGDFTVEMETGTGKTLVYLKTIQGYYFAQTAKGEYTDNERSMRTNAPICGRSGTMRAATGPSLDPSTMFLMMIRQTRRKLAVCHKGFSDWKR